MLSFTWAHVMISFLIAPTLSTIFFHTLIILVKFIHKNKGIDKMKPSQELSKYLPFWIFINFFFVYFFQLLYQLYLQYLHNFCSILIIGSIYLPVGRARIYFAPTHTVMNWLWRWLILYVDTLIFMSVATGYINYKLHKCFYFENLLHF